MMYCVVLPYNQFGSLESQALPLIALAHQNEPSKGLKKVTETQTDEKNRGKFFSDLKTSKLNKISFNSAYLCGSLQYKGCCRSDS